MRGELQKYPWNINIKIYGDWDGWSKSRTCNNVKALEEFEISQVCLQKTIQVNHYLLAQKSDTQDLRKDLPTDRFR